MMPTNWKDIGWTAAERSVLHVQKRIFRATREGDFCKVRNLQKLLSRSRDAGLVAVRRVTQVNQGKRTAGIDGRLYNKDEEKEQLVKDILAVNWETYKCWPVRRIYIPKPGKEEKRPLGIPTMKDRALQMVVKLALEPEWEAKFERNSYGFRPGRQCMDAIRLIHNVLVQRKGRISSAWILDADIAKCFDNIDHESLLKKLPVFTHVIRGWLKAGAIEFGTFTETTRGTPQGGVISPLLANIALDGMDALFGAINGGGRYSMPSARTRKNKGIIAIRYVDDFVIIAPSREILVEYVIPRLREFLRERGLALKEAKTRIVHREEGFNFLGFHVQQYVGKYRSICAVMPTKENVKKLLHEVKEILMTHKQVVQADLINMLNPKLRGWANYYRFCNAKSTFARIDHRVFQMLWWWSCRRHKGENKKLSWLKDKYFPRVGTWKWTFADKLDHALFCTSLVKCDMKRYVKVKGDASPFDPSLNQYWLKRHGILPLET
jgi:RNA-directed DNA polymerase